MSQLEVYKNAQAQWLEYDQTCTNLTEDYEQALTRYLTRNNLINEKPAENFDRGNDMTEVNTVKRSLVQAQQARRAAQKTMLSILQEDYAPSAAELMEKNTTPDSLAEAMAHADADAFIDTPRD